MRLTSTPGWSEVGGHWHIGSTQTNTQMKRIWLEMQKSEYGKVNLKNLGNGDVDQKKPASRILEGNA